MDARAKWLVTFWGFVLLVPGLIALTECCCQTTAKFPILAEQDTHALVQSVGFATLIALTLGGGGTFLHHGLRSEEERPSQPLRLPPLRALAAAFPLLVAFGLGAQQSPMRVLLFPVPMMAACVIPPIGMLIWMMDDQFGTLTWRRATVAFAAGATVSLWLAWALELLLLVLVQLVLYGMQGLAPTVAGLEVAWRALADPGFLVTVVGLVVVAPLLEEMVKPLVTLPLLPHLKSPREALLLGAVAGAGFAAMENVVYVRAGIPIWVGVLALRTLGAAVHPLTTGLVTVGWFRVLRREPGSDTQLLDAHGQAVVIHALWNGGSVLLLSWAGVRFLGAPRPDPGAFTVTVIGGVLALLALEGVLAFVAARVVARRMVTPSGRQVLEKVLGELSKDQTMGVWAVLCLVMLLPVGLAVLEGVR
jgi:RsiW-degrading membrane proteinase PrsW (M82 family)